MKNFVTFLIIAVVVIVIIVLIKKPDTDTMSGSNNGAAGTMLEGSDVPDNSMVGGDAEASIEIGGQGDTTIQ